MQLALETMSNSGLYSFSLTPTTNIGASLLGAEITTFLAPPYINIYKSPPKNPSRHVKLGKLDSRTLIQHKMKIKVQNRADSIQSNLQVSSSLFLVCEDSSRFNDIFSTSLSPWDLLRVPNMIAIKIIIKQISKLTKKKHTQNESVFLEQIDLILNLT